MYRSAALFAFIVGISSVAHASTAMNLLASGQQTIAIIDANGNGELGDEGDCLFTATADNGSLVITPSQDYDADNPLRVCEGPCEGYGNVDSSSATATITDCDWEDSPGAPFVPACLEAGSTVPSSNSSSCQSETPSGAAGGAQGSGPLTLTAARLFYPGFEFLIPEPGFGFLCNAGGTAAEISTISGRRVITPLTRNGDYLCANMPFEVVGGSRQLFDACVPVNEGGSITLAAQGNAPFAVIQLNDLPGCGGLNAAPTVSDLGLVVLGLVLLGIGAWALGRRPGFSGSLPQI